MKKTIAITFMGILAACGDDGGSSTTTDAPSVISNVEAITCDGSESATITAQAADFAYMPAAVTITAGQNVKFTMPSAHNVTPDTGGDANLKVNFSETKCLKFKAAGDYKFHCGPHQFKGTVTVQ